MIKSKKGIPICFILIAIAAIFCVINACTQQNKSETYSDGGQTINLAADGSFNAILSHNKRLSGKYTKKTENDRVVVSFIIDGTTAIGFIANNVLYFPEEWEDGHHHGNALKKK